MIMDTFFAADAFRQRGCDFGVVRATPKSHPRSGATRREVGQPRWGTQTCRGTSRGRGGCSRALGRALSLFMGTGLVEFASVGLRGRVYAGRAGPGLQPPHNGGQSPRPVI